MGDLNCQMLTGDALKALLSSAQAHEKDQAIAYVVRFLTSSDEKTRRRGYQSFEESMNEALFK